MVADRPPSPPPSGWSPSTAPAWSPTSRPPTTRTDLPVRQSTAASRIQPSRYVQAACPALNFGTPAADAGGRRHGGQRTGPHGGHAGGRGDELLAGPRGQRLLRAAEPAATRPAR